MHSLTNGMMRPGRLSKIWTIGAINKCLCIINCHWSCLWKVILISSVDWSRAINRIIIIDDMNSIERGTRKWKKIH